MTGSAPGRRSGERHEQEPGEGEGRGGGSRWARADGRGRRWEGRNGAVTVTVSRTYGHRTDRHRSAPPPSRMDRPGRSPGPCGTIGGTPHTRQGAPHVCHPPAEVAWSGPLARGRGPCRPYRRGAFSDLPVSWAARTEAPEGKTSPEELVAAAHASCFAMALSGRARPGRKAARAPRCLVRGDLRQARGGLAGRVQRADRARRGPGHSPPRISTPRPRRPRTAARSRSPRRQRRAERQGDARGLTGALRQGPG